MAIDPSISLGIRPPQIAPLQIQTPLDRYQKMLTLRHLMTQGQLGQANLAQTELENRNLQEVYQRGTSLRELLGRGGALTEAEIYGAGGSKLGGEYLKTQAEIESEKAQKAIREFDLNAKKAEMLGSIGQGILDADTPEAYEFGIKHAEHSQLITPETAAQLRTQKYNDPRTKAELQIFVRKSVEAANQWKEKREQAKFDLEKPGLQADAFKKEFGVAMQQAPDNQADWTVWRESLKPEFRRFINPMFSPLAREQAIRTGAPPEQQLTDLRSRETQAEQARRNRQLALPNQAGDFARIIADRNSTPEQKADAQEGLNLMAGYNVASRPEPSYAFGDPQANVESIVEGIAGGRQPPVTTGLYGLTGPVRAGLERKGYNLSVAKRDWDAIQRHINTLNGPQQERLRQAVSFTYDSLGQVESLYDRWAALARSGGFKILNRGALNASKQLPGEASSIASNLEAAIADLTSELGTVYKGGNASTDESLRLASENLKADWNERTFRDALKRVRESLTIRKNSILTSEPVGVTPGSPYLPGQGSAAPPPASTAAPPATGQAIKVKAPNGKEYTFPTVQEANQFKRDIGMK